MSTRVQDVRRQSSAPWVGWLLRRWPTVLAIASGVAVWGLSAVNAGRLLPLLPLVYVVMVAVRQRRLTWVVLVGCSLTVVLVNLQAAVDPALALGSVATAVTVSSVARPDAARSEAAVQAAAFLGFVAVALVGLSLGGEAARYVLAAGWFAHGAWDAVHLRRDRVVSRSYAEACGVFDVIIAAALVVG